MGSENWPRPEGPAWRGITPQWGVGKDRMWFTQGRSDLSPLQHHSFHGGSNICIDLGSLYTKMLIFKYDPSNASSIVTAGLLCTWANHHWIVTNTATQQYFLKQGRAQATFRQMELGSGRVDLATLGVELAQKKEVIVQSSQVQRKRHQVKVLGIRSMLEYKCKFWNIGYFNEIYPLELGALIPIMYILNKLLKNK